MTDARFSPGEEVQVLADFERTGHIRTPWYCRGKTGVVERICGAFGNPESLGFGGDGRPVQPLYRVRFAQADLWGKYDGPTNDCVEIEIFEHWLEPKS